MHRDLERQTTRPPASTFRAQQGLFDHFVRDFNDERPHQALDGDTPSSIWTPSSRPLPAQVPLPNYPGHYELRRVSNDGAFRLMCRRIFLSNALAQLNIGLEEIDDDVRAVFYDILLARLDERTLRPQP